VHDAFAERLVERARRLKLGNPFDASTTMGPVISALQQERVIQHIARGREEGAKVASGGEAHGEKGFFVQPTVLTGATNDMSVAQEEIFGPVATVIAFKDDAEAVRIANASR
jgi:aldehyde dehydrogenase (NAD+)